MCALYALSGERTEYCCRPLVKRIRLYCRIPRSTYYWHLLRIVYRILSRHTESRPTLLDQLAEYHSYDPEEWSSNRTGGGKCSLELQVSAVERRETDTSA